MIYCAILNKEFDTENEMFSALKANKSMIIDKKKSKILKSCEKGLGISLKSMKSLRVEENEKKFSMDDNYHYIVVNATKILDSHGDLHVDGIWNKTIKDKQGKNYLLSDHKMELDKVIAKKEDVEMLTAEIPFTMIGKSYEGTTQALIYKVAKDKIISPTAKEWLESESDIEASVRMRYINIKMAMNSGRAEDKEELEIYNKYFDMIANKEDYENISYFFVVTEAENVKESSLVLFGSNSATGAITNPKGKKQEPSPDTLDVTEPKVITQEKRKKSII
jgi:hypothetical protein